jgi:hypothetical protein
MHVQSFDVVLEILEVSSFLVPISDKRFHLPAPNLPCYFNVIRRERNQQNPGTSRILHAETRTPSFLFAVGTVHVNTKE